MVSVMHLAVPGFLAAALLVNAPSFAQALSFDQLADRLRSAIIADNQRQVLSVIEQIKATGQPAGNEILFFEGQARYRTGDTSNAFPVLVRYVNAVGQNGVNYPAAIQMLDAMEAKNAPYRNQMVQIIEGLIAAENATGARQRLSEAQQRLPGDQTLATFEPRIAKLEADAQRLRPRRERDLAVQQAALETCKADFQRTSSIGTIVDVKPDWAFAVVQFSGAVKPGPMEVVTADGPVITAKPGKVTGPNQLSISVGKEIAQVQVGQTVRRTYVAGETPACADAERMVKQLRQQLGL